MATKAKTTAKKAVGGESYLFAVKILEKFIDFIKGKMTAKLLDFSVKWLTIIGHIGIVVAAVLGFLFFIIVAIRANHLTEFLFAIVWVIAIFVIQYTAHRFSSAGEMLIKNNPTRLASKAFLDCIGFLALLAGVVFVIFQIYMAIHVASLTQFLIGLGVFVFLEFVAIVAFNAETAASMEIVSEATAGQEAIGIVTFFMKTLLRLVPIAFGIGIAVYTVIMFIDSFGLFSDVKFGAAYQSGLAHATQIGIFGLLPFISFIIFVLYFLVIDVIRSILAIPGRLGK
jgi:hypothetical protein